MFPTFFLVTTKWDVLKSAPFLTSKWDVLRRAPKGYATHVLEMYIRSKEMTKKKKGFVTSQRPSKTSISY